MAELTQYGVVTKAGITAAIDAGANGPEIRITGFRLGSLSAAEGATATEDDTDVDGFVFEGTSELMRYSRIDDDTVVWRISLPQTVGDFDVGNIGLILESGVLFAKAVLVGQSNKYKSNPPAVIGNRRFYNMVLVLSNVSNLLDITITESLTASLPEVPTELDLPDATTTPYNAYLVLNHTHLGEPTVAVRRLGAWHHSTHYKTANQGIGVLACVPTMYHASAVVGRAVKYDSVSSKFILADGADADLQAEGLRTSDYEMTTTGLITATDVGLTAPLTPGTVYYADTGANVGKLSTTVRGRAVALAVNTTDLWVNLGGSLLTATSGGTTTDPTVYITIDPDTVDSTLLPGGPVYLNGTSRIWQAADPALATKRPVGLLNQDKTKVVLLGRVEITLPTTAWPKPLTANALYYAAGGVDIGLVTGTNTTRFMVGVGHSANTMIVKLEAFATDDEHLTANAGAVFNKGATPKGVKAAVDEHAGSRNHPVASTTAVGFGRPATDAEVAAGVAAANPAYQFPWVTPYQLAHYNFPSFNGDGYVLKAGDTMATNASLVFVGTGGPKKSGVEYWHPTNDGPGSGLDADTLDGIQGAQHARNDRNDEPMANAKINLRRDAANANRGIVEILGRDSQPGGAVLSFLNGGGSLPAASLVSSTDRRTLAGQMYSDNGPTFEDQWRFDDTGDLWLRKLGKKISEMGFWTTYEASFTAVASFSIDVSLYSIIHFWTFLSVGGGATMSSSAIKGSRVHFGDASTGAVPFANTTFTRVLGTNTWGTEPGRSSGLDFTWLSTGNTLTIVPNSGVTMTGNVRLLMHTKGTL